MKIFIQFFALTFALAMFTVLHSCETTSEQDRARDMSKTSPENTGSNNNDMNSGTSGGTNKSDTGGGSVYEPGPTKDDFDVDYDDNKTTRDYNENSKSNGVREPNEYPSGRTGGQYTNPKATTTPSGTNTNENPATGTPSK